jgi:hypothetical protein
VVVQVRSGRPAWWQKGANIALGGTYKAQKARDEEAGSDTFESRDIYICGFNFQDLCVRYDGDRLADAEVTIDLILPRDEAQAAPGSPDRAGQRQGTPDGLDPPENLAG